MNPAQEGLLRYILDQNRPSDELIVKEGSVCLTWEDFWSLGLNQCMESNGREIHIVDLYVVPTWKAENVNPLCSLPAWASICIVD